MEIQKLNILTNKTILPWEPEYSEFERNVPQ